MGFDLNTLAKQSNKISIHFQSGKSTALSTLLSGFMISSSINNLLRNESRIGHKQLLIIKSGNNCNFNNTIPIKCE